MKTVFLFASLFAFCWANPVDLNDLTKNCAKKLGIVDPKFTQMTTTLLKDKQSKDFYLCRFKGAGVINDEGDIDFDALKKFMSTSPVPPELTNTIIKKCKKMELGNTPRDNAFRLEKCILKKMQKIFEEQLLKGLASLGDMKMGPPPMNQ